MNSSTLLPTHFHLFTAAFCLAAFCLAACCLLLAAAAAASASRRFEVSRRLALLTGYQRPRPLRGCKPAHPLSVCATFQRCIITISGQILPLSAPVNQIHFATPAGAGKMGVVFYFSPQRNTSKCNKWHRKQCKPFASYASACPACISLKRQITCLSSCPSCL